MALNVTYPKDSIVIVQALSTMTGGRTVDVSGNVNTVIEAGTIISDNAGTLQVLESGICQTAVASGDSVINVYKGHGFVVGSAIDGGTVTAIDTATSDVYDIITCSGTFGGDGIALNESIVTDGANAIGVVMTSKVVKEDGTVDVGILYRGEVNEAAMTAPIDANVKSALPLINFVTD